ncbi:type I-F CRISPR-associated protein Csy3 [Marinobacterium jannaschii]|uniref:type I-F CRISPR-associated protein Csy3 n=1 Tax=Marinobacterium jannaschii TaxID=64970 RepID=UPI000481EBFF|nr:type I-F CRISPR-associated protein Csy3 [Marinobacterium jannaschii]
MAKTTLRTASVLAFERKLDTSDALFSSGRWEARESHQQWPAVEIREKSVRGTLSNRLKAKPDAAIQAPNLQTVDVASLPSNSDSLKVRFTLRVLSGAGTPSACNDADYRQALGETVRSYVSAQGFAVLAQRYAVNLANGRFLWRNRVGAEAIEVRITTKGSQGQVLHWQFDAYDFSLRTFTLSDARQQAITPLARQIEQGLAGESCVLFDVVALVKLGDGQEEFPSQELILDSGDKTGQKNKTLYRIDGAAAMHSQKIGNALRTIDDWYPQEEADAVGPIAVEPYGSVTSMGRAFRQPKQKLDFFSLLDNWVIRGASPAPEQQHYVMATLIRGGVFGEKG